MLDANRCHYYFLGVMLLSGLFANMAFAEVASIKTNEDLFFKGDQIDFSGTVEKGSTGLVTIVIRDLNNEFVLLTQAIINYDDTFEKSIPVEEKFSEHGQYTVTSFILNMTQGASAEFDISLNDKPINDIEIKEELQNIIDEPLMDEKEITKETIIKDNFVDPNKDPSYYVDRYYSEPLYKSWFDSNYPGQTIEETVGYTEVEIKTTVQEIVNKELIPKASASSLVEPIPENNDDSDIAQISLAIAGLAILFGAVYGVKRQADSNTRQISLNKEIIKKKIMRPITRTNPHEILQIRLAKGEITVEEYENLEKKMKSQ